MAEGVLDCPSVITMSMLATWSRSPAALVKLLASTYFKAVSVWVEPAL